MASAEIHEEPDLAVGREPASVWVVVVTLALSLGATLMGFLTARYLERQKAEAQFEIDANQCVESLRDELEAIEEQVHALAAFYDSSEQVEPGEFETFTQRGRQRNPSLHALLWFERTSGAERAAFEASLRDPEGPPIEIHDQLAGGGRRPAPERDEHWVARYVAPPEAHAVLGLDLIGVEAWVGDLARARDEGGFVLIGPDPGLSTGPRGSVLLALPIYRDPRQPIGEESRRQAFRGFVCAGFLPAAVFEHVLRDEQPGDASIEVVDDALPAGGRTLFRRGPAIDPEGSTYRHAAEIEIGGRVWTGTCSPTPAALRARTSGLPWLVLVAGGAISALLTLFVAATTSRRRVRRLVEERTEVLQQRNRSLIDEIERRLEAEGTLRQSQEALARVLDAAPDAVVTMDQQGYVTGWNRRAETMFGWSGAEAVDQVLAELIIPPAARDEHHAGLKRYLHTGKGRYIDRRVEVTAQRRDGATFPVELTIVAYRTAHGHEFSGFIRPLSDGAGAS